MAKVTVFSAFYNCASFVDRTVKSIFSQTFDDYEFYAVDDGSLDSTLAALQKFTHPRLHVITHDNIGFVRAMISAIAASDSEYIAILGPGDEAVQSRLDRQSRFLDENPSIGLTGSHIKTFRGNGQHSYVYAPQLGTDPATALLKRSVYAHTSVMFRRELYEKVGGYRDIFEYCYDVDLWLRMSEIAQLGMIPEILTINYEPGDDSATAPSKAAYARLFRTFAIHCAQERRAGHGDPLDQFGYSGALLRPRSRRLAGALGRDALYAFLHGDPAAQDVARLAIDEAWTPFSVAAAFVASCRKQQDEIGSVAQRYRDLMSISRNR